MSGLWHWVDSRTGLSELYRAMADEEVPGGARLRYVFGSVLTFLFMQQVVLGILLATYYSPSATDAWASTAYLQDQVTGGWFLRGLHHHGSSMMVVVVALHLIQVVIAGAYRAPREFNWWIGLLMGGLVLAFALTGYLLPWDQKGYWATQVATGIMGSVPGGGLIQELLVGGTEYGNLTLTRFYALHVFVLPLGLGGLLVAHLYLFRRHGVTPPDLPESTLEARCQPFMPFQLFLDVLAMTVTGAALVVLTFATHGAELFAPADPAANFMARPEWYFLFLFQLLKYFEGPLQLVGTVLIPGGVAAFFFALPLLDRAPTRAVRGRGKVLSLTGLIMAGVVALTALAMAEDAQNQTYQEGLEVAHAEANRARELARDGVLPEGGDAVWRNDPAYVTRALFDEHCSVCHAIDGVGGQEAPDLGGFSTRAWLVGGIRTPRDVRYFGGTKGHGDMEAYDEAALPQEQLDAVIEYLVRLRGEPEVLAWDDALADKGARLWEDTLECSGCHEVEKGAGGGAPNFAGRGTQAWIDRVIRNSGGPDLYEGDAQMPRFEGKLSDAEIAQLAAFVHGQGLAPRDDDASN